MWRGPFSRRMSHGSSTACSTRSHARCGPALCRSAMGDKATSGAPSGEEAIIALLAPLADGFPGAFGLKDDCALLTPEPGTELVLKTDPVAEGVHFLAEDAPQDIAWKALAVNVSDLAAKGAHPVG